MPILPFTNATSLSLHINFAWLHCISPEKTITKQFSQIERNEQKNNVAVSFRTSFLRTFLGRLLKHKWCHGWVDPL